jgi:hypothetical protein
VWDVQCDVAAGRAGAAEVRRGRGDVCGHAGASPRAMTSAQERSAARPAAMRRSMACRAIYSCKVLLLERWNAGSAGTLDFGCMLGLGPNTLLRLLPGTKSGGRSPHDATAASAALAGTVGHTTHETQEEAASSPRPQPDCPASLCPCFLRYPDAPAPSALRMT